MEEQLYLNFETIDEDFKNIAYVLVPNDIQDNNIGTYVDKTIAPYDDNYVGNPTIVARLDEILEEFEEDRELYKDIDEFCLNMYGGFINGEHIVSTINYDAFWCRHNMLGHMSAQTLAMLLNSNALCMPKVIIDVNSKMYEKTKLYTDDSWKEMILEILENNSECQVMQLEYI